MEGYVQNIPRLRWEGIDILEHRNTIHGVYIQVDLEGLTECLEMLGTAPFPILAGGNNHFLEPPFHVFLGRSGDIGRASSIRRRSRTFRPSALPTFSNDKLHKVIFIGSHVIG